MFRKLDSLRGLIALTMALYHSQFFFSSGGIEMLHNAYLCVDMLFMLSGFLLAAAYGERIRHGLPARQFVLLRVGRLYPLHFVMMLVWLCYVLAKQTLYQHGFGGHDPLKNNDFPSFFGSLLMLHSMGLFDRVNWNVPSWSIGALILTYISFFVFCRVTQRALWLKALSIALLGYAFIGLVLRKTNFDITYDYGFVRCLSGFYAGVFCYRLKQHFRIAPLSLRSVALLEVLALAAFFIVLNYAESHVAILYGSLPLLSAIILLLSSQQSGWIGRLLETRALRWIGSLAFSIYLTHYIIVLTAANFCQYILHWPMQPVREQYGIPVKGFIGVWTLPINMALIACVLGISYATYRWIETPCRRWSRALAMRWENAAPLLSTS